jgi:hypothetical protein
VVGVWRAVGVYGWLLLGYVGVMIIKLKRAGTFLHPFDEEGREFFRSLEIGQEIEVEVPDKENPKTAAQRGALHIFLRDLAQILNDSGCDQVAFIAEHLKPGTRLPWTLYSVKESLYKPILAAMTGKVSTEQMSTVEPSAVCTVLGQKLSEKIGITPPPWPSRFGD